MTFGSLPPVKKLIEECLITAPECGSVQQAHTLARWWHRVSSWQPGLPATQQVAPVIFPSIPSSPIKESNHLHSPNIPCFVLADVSVTQQIRAQAISKLPLPEDASEPEWSPQREQTLVVAEHLQAATGEIVFSSHDFSISGPLPFRWQRVYRSGIQEDFGLGPGWLHPLCERLWIHSQDGAAAIYVLCGDGRYVQFSQPVIGEACVNRTEGLVLQRQGQMSYRLLQAGRADRIFRADGANTYFPLVELRDSAGNTLSIDYQNGLPRKMVSSWGRVIEFKCEQQQIVAIHNAAASTTQTPYAQYTYTEGQLVQSQDGQVRKQVYSYANGRLVSRRTVSGRTYEFTWNEKSSRCSAIHDGIVNHKITWRASLRRAVITSSEQHTLAAEFDVENRMISFRDAEGYEQKWFYDGYGNLCSHTNALGETEYFRWDRFANCVRRTRADGVSTRYQFGEDGSLAVVESALKQVWLRETNRCGQIVAERDPIGAIWQYRYNEKQQLDVIEDPEQGKTRFSWNSLGELEKVTTAEGIVTQLEYDAQGRLTRVARGSEALLEYRYNAQNRLSEVTLFGGEHWVLHYDDLGRLAQLEIVDGFAVICNFDDCGRPKSVKTNIGYAHQFEYQGSGLKKISHNQGVEIYRYNRNGWLVNTTDARGRERDYEYDAAGRLTVYRDMSSISYIERDKCGKITKTANNSGENRQYHYDPLSRLVLADNGYSAVRYQYDLCNNILAEHHDNEAAGSHSFHYQYDKRGWRVKCTTENQLLAYLHTPDGKLRGIDINGKAALRCDHDEQAREVVWVQGDVKTRIQWRGAAKIGLQSRAGKSKDEAVVLEREFNTEATESLRPVLGYSASGPNRVRNEGEVDNRGNLLGEPTSEGMCHYAYNGWNQLVSAENNEFKAHYRYDPFGRRINKQITHRKTKYARQTTFRWQNGYLWSEQHTGPNGTEALHYLRHPQSGELLVLFKEEKPYYLLNTPNLQPLQIFAANGDIAWQANYDANGNYAGLQSKPTLVSPWRSNTDYYDSESQLYCNGLTYFSVKLGRNLHG